jgi:hypothetical protein
MPNIHIILILPFMSYKEPAMTDNPPESTPVSGASSTAGANPPPPMLPTQGEKGTDQPKQPQAPISQTPSDYRANWPVWAKQLPRIRFPQQQPRFQLIDKAKLMEILTEKNIDAAAIKRIETDMQFLEAELLRLFRDRDYEASMQQNRYRLVQIGYIVLAALATLFGSLQALALNSADNRLLPWMAFAETLVALIVTFLATVSGREPPLPLYLTNRRRAESLRREYFRYLMNLPPYDSVEGPQRRVMLSSRSADINRGVFPDEGQG